MNDASPVGVQRILASANLLAKDTRQNTAEFLKGALCASPQVNHRSSPEKPKLPKIVPTDRPAAEKVHQRGYIPVSPLPAAPASSNAIPKKAANFVTRFEVPSVSRDVEKPAGLVPQMSRAPSSAAGLPSRQNAQKLPKIQPAVPNSPRSPKTKRMDLPRINGPMVRHSPDIERRPMVRHSPEVEGNINDVVAPKPRDGLRYRRPTCAPLCLYKKQMELAQDNLKEILKMHENGEDYSGAVVEFLSSITTLKATVLSDWLLQQPRNAYVWSTIHYRIRYMSTKRHLRLAQFVERHVKQAQSVTSYLLYVKGWMEEFDNLDGPHYKSVWLRMRSNRFHFAKYFKQVPNCQLIGHFVRSLLDRCATTKEDPEMDPVVAG